MRGKADVVVVGGGVIGTALAHALARDGAGVVLLEARSVASGTSSHTFAWLNATSKYDDAGYHRLNAAGMARYRELAREFGDQRLGLDGGGMFAWTGGDDAALDALRSQHARLETFGYPVRWLEAADLAALEPRVRIPDEAAGLFALADGWVDGATLTAFLAERVRALGGEILEGTQVRALETDAHGRVRAVASDGGGIEAPTVVLATGPETAELVKALCGDAAAAYPMRRVKGLLVETPNLQPWRWLRHVHYSTCFGELHMRPTHRDTLLLGAEDLDETIADDDSQAARLAGARIMIERLRRYLPDFPEDVSAEHCTLLVGVRPMPADGLPIVGPLPWIDGLHVVTTHSGMTLAPLLGDLLAEELLTGTMPDMLAPYRYDRFAE